MPPSTTSFVLFLALSVVIIQQISAGVIYTRWGRKTCGNGSQLLFSGYVGGAHYTFSGSGANYLCLHNDPQWGSGNVPGNQIITGLLYGVEYEINTGYGPDKPFSVANNGGNALQNYDAVCAVCYNPKSTTQYMVAGRQICPSSDMRLEYSGYLMSAYYLHYRSEFVCVDKAPESRPGGEANNDGGLFYPVQGSCGSLPCPPYVERNEITCALCTI